MSSRFANPISGREVVIVEAARTPIGRGNKDKGYYRATHPNELLGLCYRAVIERAGRVPQQTPSAVKIVRFSVECARDAR